jgi:hypothetical protein
MADIEAPDNDVLEQEQPPDDPAAPVSSTPDERDIEAPEADSVEQNRAVREDEHDEQPGERSVESDPADAADRDAGLLDDEDDYR